MSAGDQLIPAAWPVDRAWLHGARRWWTGRLAPEPAGPMPEPVTWAEHDRAHERSRPYSRTGGNDSRAYVLAAGAWPDVLRCGQCGQHVLPRSPDDPLSFLDHDPTETTRKATP